MERKAKLVQLLERGKGRWEAEEKERRREKEKKGWRSKIVGGGE